MTASVVAVVDVTNTGAGNTSLQAVIPAVLLGDAIHLYIGDLNTGQTITVSDDVNGTWGPGVNNTVSSTGFYRMIQFSMAGCKAGTTTITVTWTSSVNFNTLQAVHLTGVSSLIATAGQAQGSVSAGTTDGASSGTASASGDGLIIGFCLATDHAAPATLQVPGTGFSDQGITTNYGTGNQGRHESRPLAAPGSVAATFTTGSGPWDFLTMMAVYTVPDPFVRHATSTDGGGSSNSSLVSSAIAVSLGDALHVFVGSVSSSDVIAVADSLNGPWGAALDLRSGSSYSFRQFSKPSSLAGSCVITVSWTSGAVTFNTAVFVDIANVGSLTDHAGNVQLSQGNATDAITSTAVTNAIPGFMVALSCIVDSLPGAHATPGTGFTDEGSYCQFGTSPQGQLESRSVGTTGTPVAATFTGASGTPNYITEMALYPVVSVLPSVLPPIPYSLVVPTLVMGSGF